MLVSTTGTSFPFTLPHTNYASSTSRLAFSFWRGTNITTDFCTYHGHQKSYDPFCAVFCFRAPIFSSTRTSIIISIVLELIRSRTFGGVVLQFTGLVLSEESCYNLVGFPVVLGTKRVFWHDVIAQQIPPDLTLSPYSPS